MPAPFASAFEHLHSRRKGGIRASGSMLGTFYWLNPICSAIRVWDRIACRARPVV